MPDIPKIEPAVIRLAARRAKLERRIIVALATVSKEDALDFVLSEVPLASLLEMATQAEEDHERSE